MSAYSTARAPQNWIVADALVGFGDRRMIEAGARVHGYALPEEA